MNILVIGDVHGCYHTLSELIAEHWNPESDFLVQVGDLINKGPHSALCYKLMRKLQKRYPYQVFVLKGNHEVRYLTYQGLPGRSASIDKTKKDFIRNEVNLRKLHKWLQDLPYKWETPNILITHGGISKTVTNPYTSSNPRGVIHNRSALRNVGKVQVYGHMIQTDGKINFSPAANAWCIDSGAWLGKRLSALRLSYDGEVMERIHVITKPEDLIT
jgi:serine/threonine protein phosphatase 1